MTETDAAARPPPGETRPTLWVSILHPENTGRGEEPSAALWLTERDATIDALLVLHDLLQVRGEEPAPPPAFEAMADEALLDALDRARDALAEVSPARVEVHRAVAEAEPMIPHVRAILAEHGLASPA